MVVINPTEGNNLSGGKQWGSPARPSRWLDTDSLALAEHSAIETPQPAQATGRLTWEQP
jgi:hypothetical protein